ncbi:MAG: hypothetical protein JSV90_00125 [Methanobacteriota archaeon]|nr:MAG: hypothetical protein JSV90_00125 [Euryarchaeota archaeon]
MSGRENDARLWRVAALALIIVAFVFGALAISAQSDIDDIGDSNDPSLQGEVQRLQNERDAYVVSAIGFAFLGLFGFFTLTDEGIPLRLAEAQMISSAKTRQSMVSGLSVLGNGSYLPASHGLTKQRVLIQATEGSAGPPSALSDDMVVTPGRDGSLPGMLVDPPGLKLLETVEADYGAVISNAGIESAEGSLQVLKHSLSLLKDFHFKERDGKTVLRVEYGILLPACRAVRRDAPDTCRQMACIGCSCLLLAAAKATNKVVKVEDVDNSGDTVVFTLQLSDW